MNYFYLSYSYRPYGTRTTQICGLAVKGDPIAAFVKAQQLNRNNINGNASLTGGESVLIAVTPLTKEQHDLMKANV